MQWKKVDFSLYLVKASHLQIWLPHFNAHLQKQSKKKKKKQYAKFINIKFPSWMYTYVNF